MVTIKNIKKRLEHHKRLELAGAEMPGGDAGAPVILWTVDRDENETWKILPERVANLILDHFAQSGEVAKAAIYRKPPDNAPLGIVREWIRQKYERRIQP